MTRLLALILLLIGFAGEAAAQSRAEIERTMKRATRFMVEEASTKGGYVWS